ncbi:MAG TPA: TolC family protein [bacterium]|nr:TolC family protein [bacterium]
MRTLFRNYVSRILFRSLIFVLIALPLSAQRRIDFTLETAAEIAMQNSYEVQQLQLNIDRTRKWLEAERAGLKSRVYMRLQAPEFQAISDYKWNSILGRNEIVRQNTRLWQMNLSIEQPVILFGYPTNGYLSLNNRMYRYLQQDGVNDIQYYNRYFVRFEQPLFQPNRLKNDIEEARIDLSQQELEYTEDLMDLLEETADDYYELLELSYRGIIYTDHIENLEQAAMAVDSVITRDSSRSIEQTQIEVELANARERLAQTQSDLRLETSRMKQELRLPPEDSLVIDPRTTVTQIQVDQDQAIEYGYNLHPQLRLQHLRRREEEIELENERGDNSFHLNLEMTYGLEKADPRYYNLWESQDNSYTVSLNAYLPIWDWGQRRAEIQARQITLKKRDLYLEEFRNEIRSEISNDIVNLTEYQRRALTMKENLTRAREISGISLDQYGTGQISMQDLLQSFDREVETAQNFLHAYLGYRNSLLSLMEDTYYDFERDQPILERFGVEQSMGEE